MKSQINEVKLIYRTLSDQFFVIHKPVNWTLKKKKKEKSCPNSSNEYIKDIYDKNINLDKNKITINNNDNNIEYIDYKSTLQNLSNAEKNAYFYTNSSLFMYNNFNTNTHDELVEKYYVESMFQVDQNKDDIYYPYKLPIYMSGLVICCKDFSIYKTFVKMINQNKLIRKYRCLINNPFVFVKNEMDNSIINNNNNNCEVKKKKYTYEKGNYYNNINKEIYNQTSNTYLLNKDSLYAQKNISDLFPFHNFFDNNSYSSTYWNYLTELKLNELNDIEKGKKKTIYNNNHNNIKNYKYQSNKLTDRKFKYLNDHRKREEIKREYFISTLFKKSEPIKCLNHFYNTFFKNNNKENILNLKTNTQIKQRDNKIINNNENLLDELTHKIILHNSKDMLKNNKITYPLNILFNEGSFFFFHDTIDEYSFPFSIIYNIVNYKHYLENKKSQYFKNDININNYLETFKDIYLVDFILLDNPKPDLIRFFFSEINTPIINDNIFQINVFKKDIINDQILKNEQINNSTNNNISSIFHDHNVENNHHSVDNNDCNVIYNENTIIINNHINKKKEHSSLQTHNLPFDTFTIPGYDNNPNNVNTKNEIKVNCNNYFIYQENNQNEHLQNGINNNIYNNKKNNNNNNNLCLELYHLQFFDPINKDYIKIENSLSNSWL
ncbi:hypothetical protein PFAG_02397 [Plasmodium falciparum Santa Lucia]|uniref:Uncharacterized protein n=2 Tax=Plasmodium falciparum TaxID=5833 RepID=A0A024W772_PLAFA|nr:hypothetical protein PFTANZ_02490 [Plasmodium falciparum Tanzania (2000708)]EUT86528.1 hypothetical protein PFAG_02397 [Plasmodium falciparum Santa Lucia]